MAILTERSIYQISYTSFSSSFQEFLFLGRLLTAQNSFFPNFSVNPPIPEVSQIARSQPPPIPAVKPSAKTPARGGRDCAATVASVIRVARSARAAVLPDAERRHPRQFFGKARAQFASWLNLFVGSGEKVEINS